MKRSDLLRIGFAALGLLPSVAFAQSVATLAAPSPARNSATAETSFGDLVADAIRGLAGADCALVPAGALTDAGLAQGGVTAAQVDAALTYGRDPVVLVRLTGRQIDAALERAWAIYPLRHQGLLQVSGLAYSVDRTRAAGDRVSEIRAGSSAVSTAASYTVAMPASLSDGGLGYFKIWDKSAVIRSTKTSIADALTRYLSSHSPVSPPAAGRARVVH